MMSVRNTLREGEYSYNILFPILPWPADLTKLTLPHHLQEMAPIYLWYQNGKP